VSAFVLLVALGLLRCGAPVEPPRRSEGAPSKRPASDWFVVDAAEAEVIAGIGEDRILLNAIAPVLLERPEFVMPDRDSPVPWYGVILVHTIVGPNGRIARARIDKGPVLQGLEEAIARCLRDWRFTPGHLPGGGPRAVHYYVRLPISRPRIPRSADSATALAAWLVVDAEENAAIEGECIHGIGFDGFPPQPIKRRALELPPEANTERRPVIVETVIGPSGRIARARIVKGPTGPDIERAVVLALEGWWFEPARKRDTHEPVAVRFVVTPRLADK